MTVIIPSDATLRSDARVVQDPERHPTAEVEYFEEIEFFKGDVWLAGRVSRGQHRRLSDVLNHASSGLFLHDAVVCGPPGLHGRREGHDVWIDLRDIDLVGDSARGRGPAQDGEPTSEHVAKRPQRLTVWTASHEIHGTVHLYPQADLEAFLRSDDPPLIAMTDAEVSWVSPGRTTRRFPFVLLNRRRIFATRVG